MDLLIYEKELYKEGYNLICGVDEAGRGPLAGSVFAAAVILPKGLLIEGVNDSKKLTPKKREKLFDDITEKAIDYSIASASVEEIEKINILNAAMLAMKRACESLKCKPEYALVDGNKLPELSFPCRAIVKGDSNSESIAAASILAKVARDREMLELSKIYPLYHFEKHKGYGTKLHVDMIREHGVCPIHRKSFLKKILDIKGKGTLGENFIARYIEDHGGKILNRNYHSRYGEIDLVAKNKKFIMFIEVKLRKEHTFVSPAEAVTKSKQEKLMKTAQDYLAKNPTNLQPRFDVAEVTMKSNGELFMNYIENAFFQKTDYAIF